MSEVRRIGKYEIVGELGRGRFAVVYRARDAQMGREVALKVISGSLAQEREFVERFQQEARVAASLNHSNIVPVYEFGEAGGLLYLAMALIGQGRTLRDLLAEHGPLTLEQALPILEQVAEALDHAHAQGAVHGDVKPSNVMVEQAAEGVRATLTDFGLVKALADSTALTSRGTLLGSPEYMAPEQADPERAAEVGPAADRYALGVVAYQMFTGRVPFPGSTPATLYAHEHKPVPPPRSLCPGLSQAVEGALLQMLAKAPARRFPSACAFVAQLREAPLAEQQAARLAPLYEQLQAVAARQEWAEVLTLGGRIQELAPAYRDVAGWMGRARDHLRRPPRRPLRVRPDWLWPVVGGVAALLVVIGIAVVVVPRLFGMLLPPTFVPQPTDTRVPPTATSRPTETPLMPTATLLPIERATPGRYTATSVVPTATLPPIETATPEQYTTARPPAEASIGDTWTRPADGMVMVYVPAGEFLMGSSDADGQARDDEKPQHTVYLDAYWIDRTEVTNAQYRKCVEAGACREPECWSVRDQPVVCVGWGDAQAYAAWVGGRLPTEAEWEKAARGMDGRIYPWGNGAPDCSRANYSSCVGRPAVVGSYPAGASPYGALDMAGNVWEWVADWYEEGYYARSPDRNPQGPAYGGLWVVRGGSFYLGRDYARCASRYRNFPLGDWSNNYGFRVVVSRAPG